MNNYALTNSQTETTIDKKAYRHANCDIESAFKKKPSVNTFDLSVGSAFPQGDLYKFDGRDYSLIARGGV